MCCCGDLIPRRFVINGLLFWAFINAYTMRTCMSVTVIAMATNPDYDEKDKETEEEKYLWSEQLQGTILSAFYYGYLVTHLPGGYLADKYGGRRVLTISVAIATIATACIPVCALLGDLAPYFVVAMRVVAGLGDGFLFPAASRIMSNWIPPLERSKFATCVYTGTLIGACISISFSGVIISTTKSWALVFFVYTGIAALWFCIWVTNAYDDPASDPNTSPEEMSYITSAIGQAARDKNLPDTPWKQILTSCPIYALICAQFANDYSFYTLINTLPKYLYDVVGVDMSDLGVVAAMPFVVMWASANVFAYLADYLKKNDILEMTTVRRTAAAFEAAGVSLFVLLAGYETKKELVLVYFCFAMLFQSCYYPGAKSNVLDLAPNYSGSISAVVNGSGCVMGMIAPSFTAYMTPNRLATEYQTVYLILACFICSMTTIYLFFGSAEVQWWNSGGDSRPPA